jgi:hypothetical protein
MSKVYFVQIVENRITAKGEGPAKTDEQVEVTKEIYNQLTRLPADFEMDSEGNIVSVMPAPEPEPQPPEPTTEEILLVALQEIQALKNKVAELEGR